MRFGLSLCMTVTLTIYLSSVCLSVCVRAGGVAMGCIADSPLNAGVAIACGMGAGLISTLGYNLLQVRL